MILDDVDHADVMNPILREKGIKSMLGVPLIVRGDVIGVLHVGTLTPRKFNRDDVELLEPRRGACRPGHGACAFARAGASRSTS